MHTTPILKHLKKYGQLMDSEIAAATGIHRYRNLLTKVKSHAVT
jgi:hypothetical protein